MVGFVNGGTLTSFYFDYLLLVLRVSLGTPGVLFSLSGSTTRGVSVKLAR